MSSGIGPLDFMLVALAGWMNQRQQLIVYYLLAENRILTQQMAYGAITRPTFVMLPSVGENEGASRVARETRV